MEVSSSMERIENYRREDYESHKSSTEMSAHKVEDHDSDYITTASPNSSKSATPDGIQDEREQHLTENREQVFVALESLGVINLKVNSFDHLLNCRDNDSDTNDEIAEDIKATELDEIKQSIDLDVAEKSSSDPEDVEVPPEELEPEAPMSRSFPNESHAHQRGPTIIRAHRTSRPSSRSSQVARVEKDSAKTTHTNHTTSKARFHKVANRGKIFHIKKSKSNDIKPTTNDEAITANLDKAETITANVVNLESTEEVVQQEDDNNNIKEKEENFEDMNSNSTDERHSNSSGEEKDSDSDEKNSDESEDIGEQLERKIQSVKTRFQNLVTRGREWTKSKAKPEEMDVKSEDGTEADPKQEPSELEQGRETPKASNDTDDSELKKEETKPETECNHTDDDDKDTEPTNDTEVTDLQIDLEEQIRKKETTPMEFHLEAVQEHHCSTFSHSNAIQDSKEFFKPKQKKPPGEHPLSDKVQNTRTTKPRKTRKKIELKYESDFDSNEEKPRETTKGTSTRNRLPKSKKIERAVDESKFYRQWISPRVSRQEIRSSISLDKATKEEFRHIISSVLDERTHTMNDDSERATRRHDRNGLINDNLEATTTTETSESPAKELLNDNQLVEEEKLPKDSSSNDEFVPIFRPARKESESQHKFSLAGQDELLNESRRKVCLNLRENLNGLKMNRKMPHFFRDRTTAFFGIIHSAVFGTEDLQPEEAEIILGIGKDTIDQLAKYEEERNVIEKQIASTVSLDDEDSSHEEAISEVHMSRKRNETVNPARKPKNQGVPRTPLPRVRQLKEQFRTFAKFGDRHNDGTHITLSRCDKWLRQSGVIDETILTTTDTAILFRRMSKTHVWMTFREFQKFLKALAQSKALDLKLIMNALVACGSPQYGKITDIDTCILLQRLTDVSLYGGTHRARFDSRGRGMGVEGRRDPRDLHWINSPSPDGLLAITPKPIIRPHI